MTGSAGHRLRALGRFLGFGALFVALFLTAATVLPLVVDVPALDADPLGALVVQGALLLGAALVASWAMLALEGAPRDLGFGLRRRAAREVGLGLVAGTAGVLAVVAALTLAGVYRFEPEPGSVTGWLGVAAGSLLAFAIPAAAEEAVFRGYALRALREAGGTVAAVLATSVMFALAHGANPEVGGLALVNIFAAGVLLAVAVLRTGSLWFASAVHLGWNWVMAGPLDLPVSGLDLFDAPYYDGVTAGPAWLGGGPFGPEGGLAGTAAAVLVLTLIVYWTRPGAVLAPADSEGEAEGWRRSTG